jgi:3-phosphoshikimate 1-carboxyvinyltransferase
LVEIYRHFGVETTFDQHSITISKQKKATTDRLLLNLVGAPDIAQTIAVTCFALSIPCTLTGLHTLKIKETDRLVALENELTKLGAIIAVTNERLDLEVSTQMHSNIAIETYHDHRMAMAFAPLAMKVPITILDANVVTKSYRDFWADMEQIGFQIKEDRF